MSAIVIEGLSKSFQTAAHSTRARVLDAVSVEVAEGEFIGLLGPSGCGKTTLLRCVAGLETPDDGVIRIGKRAVVDMAARTVIPPESRGIGMVFQSYALWPHMTIAENVAYPLRRRRVRRAERPAKIANALELVGLGGLGDRRPNQLSGGQQQRVAIARAIVSEPRVLLFDEPLSNLDANLRRLVRREIRALHERIGTTTLYVTHDQDEVGALADRVVVMSDGVVVQSGQPAHVFSSPASRRVAEFVGFDNYIPARPAGAGAAAVGNATVRYHCPDHVAAVRPAVLAVRGRSLHLRNNEAPDGMEVLGRGRVISVARLGDSVEAEVELDGADTRLVSVSDTRSLDWARAGDTAIVAARREDIAALAEPTSSARI